MIQGGGFGGSALDRVHEGGRSAQGRKAPETGRESGGPKNATVAWDESGAGRKQVLLCQMPHFVVVQGVLFQ